MSDEARLTITTENGTAKLTLDMSAEALVTFQELAKKRGVSLAELFAEALRLERLFTEARTSDRKLYLHDSGELRELVAV